MGATCASGRESSSSAGLGEAVLAGARAAHTHTHTHRKERGNEWRCRISSVQWGKMCEVKSAGGAAVSQLQKSQSCQATRAPPRAAAPPAEAACPAPAPAAPQCRPAWEAAPPASGCCCAPRASIPCTAPCRAAKGRGPPVEQLASQANQCSLAAIVADVRCAVAPSQKAHLT